MQFQSEDAMPPEEQAQRGHKRKAHRGRRAMKAKDAQPDAMGEANTHLKKAAAHPTKAGTAAHIFKALGSLKKC